jgi:uncharacterized protein (TIGR04141 family)
MGSINLYKIDEEKNQIFIQEITQRLHRVNTINIEKRVNDENVLFGLTLYVSTPQEDRGINWNWLLEAFNTDILNVTPSPKSVLMIEQGDTIYAVTFGHAFFFVDKFCDRDFSFKFARKIRYKEIKTTALTSPHSKRNKMINTYINYNELEFDSGESFSKIKVKAALPDGFDIFKPSIEVGNSIKFSIEQDSLDAIIEIIIYIEDIIANQEDLYQIPVFSKVNDIDLLGRLEGQLAADIRRNPATVNISELDIIGATEIFNNNDSEFILKYRRIEKQISLLSNDEIQLFCNENELILSDILLDIVVISRRDGQAVRTDTIKNLIDYTSDTERCLLSKGIWYKYNDDYLHYLRDSISEIKVIYNQEYDFLPVTHSAFLEERYVAEKGEPKYAGKTEHQIRDSLAKKYYAERSFNLIREANNGFRNFDRIEQRIGSVDIELMDLYKDNTMFAVKIGNTSAKLCYTIDQSLTSLKMYKHHQLNGMPEINTVAIWLILERENHLPLLDNGAPDIDSLNMLMLKNRIDQWKKEVRVLGYKPIIAINYTTV